MLPGYDAYIKIATVSLIYDPRRPLLPADSNVSYSRKGNFNWSIEFSRAIRVLQQQKNQTGKAMDDDPIAVGMPRPALPNDETADQPKEAKCDLFYKFWDKFTKKKSLKLTPSIDRDEEGLPSHHPEKNEEGIVTK